MGFPRTRFIGLYADPSSSLYLRCLLEKLHYCNSPELALNTTPLIRQIKAT